MDARFAPTGAERRLEAKEPCYAAGTGQRNLVTMLTIISTHFNRVLLTFKEFRFIICTRRWNDYTASIGRQNKKQDKE